MTRFGKRAMLSILALVVIVVAMPFLGSGAARPILRNALT